jgi:CubicO group peptidase (beta-lactamase class C family)
VTVDGVCDERFAKVREVFAGHFESGADVGASVAVVLDGELVVDLWGGHVDPELTTPWERDTITNVWSTTKTMTALCALVLADRGELDFHAPVARYWPEFSAAGKGGVEVRHLMSHTAGLPGWSEPISEDDLYDWEKATSLLAAQEPWWEPGTAQGYHAVTQGYLVGEVVRRISGMSLGTFFAAEIAGPLGADFHIGLPASEDGRVARVVPPAELPRIPPADSVAARTFANPPIRAETSWGEKWRRAEIPAANGHGNARSVALVQALLAGGGGPGSRGVISAAGCEAVFEEQSYARDLVLGMKMRLGIGYGLTCPETPLSPNPRACFWGGWGGSIVVVDLDARMVVAYVMNKMGEGTTGDFRGAALVFAATASLAGAGAG